MPEGMTVSEAPRITVVSATDHFLAGRTEICSGFIRDSSRPALLVEKFMPSVPCYRAAFKALEKWVEEGHEAPPNELVPRTKGSGLKELAYPEVNFC
jgi:hypothetical protein